MTEKPCSEPDCASPSKALGMCSVHYDKYRRETEWRICSVEGCDRRVRNVTRMLCRLHYERVRSTGNPGPVGRRDMRTPLQERFAKFLPGELPEDGCWEWQGARVNPQKGRDYGSLGNFFAHRVSWELANGMPIPEGLHVLHACDNPPCVNPAHLSVGTHHDNMRDMASKARQRWGEQHSNAKLSEDDVLAMREMRRGGALVRVIADKFGVSESHASRLTRGIKWVHLDDGFCDGREAKVTYDDVLNMRKRFAEGVASLKELAIEYGISRPHASDIVRGRRYGTELATPAPNRYHDLSDDDVFEMRQLRAGGMSYTKIAAQFGMSNVYARKICLGICRSTPAGFSTWEEFAAARDLTLETYAA